MLASSLSSKPLRARNRRARLYNRYKGAAAPEVMLRGATRLRGGAAVKGRSVEQVALHHVWEDRFKQNSTTLGRARPSNVRFCCTQMGSRWVRTTPCLLRTTKHKQQEKSKGNVKPKCVLAFTFPNLPLPVACLSTSQSQQTEMETNSALSHRHPHFPSFLNIGTILDF